MALGDGKSEKEVKGINKELGYILDAVSSIGDKLVKSFEDAVDSASNLNSAVDVVGKTMKRGLVADLKKAVENTNSLIDLQTKVTLGTATQRDIAKEAEKIALNQSRLEAKRLVLGDKLTKVQRSLLAQEEEQLKFQEKVLQTIKEGNTELQKQKSFYQVLKENAGDLADKIDKTGTLSKIVTGNFKDILTPLRLAELAIVGIFNAAKSIDESTGKLAKNLNISAGDALKLQRELNSAANTSNTLSVTTKGLGEALMAVNGQLGIFNTTIDENLISFEQLNKTAGLTYDELSGVYKITNATGGDLEANTKEIMAQARLTGQKFGVALNEKEVLKDISNISAATTLSLGKSGAAIANAVSTAKSLGMELSKVENISDSLLQFENSIASELEAELLLGRDINLEKARQAALNNDLATVASEIAKQAGSAAEFGKMNRIQQEALAAAVGMGREELAKTLFTQEQIGNLTGDEYELRAKQINELEAKGLSQAQIKEELGKKSLDDLKNQNSIQEKLTQSVGKMNELFVSLAVPIMQIVTPIVDLLLPAVEMLGYLFEAISAPISYIVDLFKQMNEYIGSSVPLMSALGVAAYAYMATREKTLVLRSSIFAKKKAESVIEGINNTYASAGIALAKMGEAIKTKGLMKTIGEAAMSAFASVAKIPFIGPVLGIAAAASAAALGYKYLQGDDVMSPGGGGEGYGNRTLMGPEGAIALNNKDTVIAGTNLFPKDNNSKERTNTIIQQDNTESKRTNMLLEKIANQSPVFKIGTDEFFTSTSKYSYQVQ
jgi:hypothetical protein